MTHRKPIWGARGRQGGVQLPWVGCGPIFPLWTAALGDPLVPPADNAIPAGHLLPDGHSQDGSRG